MNKEQYVSFGVAKLLKEKGFDWSTPKLYGNCRVYNGEPIDFDTECELKDEGKGDKIITAYMQYDMWWVKSDFDLGIPCPTQAVACRWLREEKRIGIFPSTYSSYTTDGGETKANYGTAIIDLETRDLMCNDMMQRKTYEDAVEAALEYCLTELI